MRRNFTRILVPTDFGAPSDAALDLAKTMAATSGASLHLLHVLEDPFMTSVFATEFQALPPADLREKWLERARTWLNEQLTPAEQASFRSTELVVPGPPAQTIVDYAKANDIDLIVMGTHGRRGVKHLLMGSVAERVVRAAACPVLTVRDHGDVRTVTPATTSAVV